MSFKTREYTNKILELVDDGIVDKDWLIQGLLCWLSERDVEEFYHAKQHDCKIPMIDVTQSDWKSKCRTLLLREIDPEYNEE